MKTPAKKTPAKPAKKKDKSVLEELMDGGSLKKILFKEFTKMI
jgi:hypothetical protein